MTDFINKNLLSLGLVAVFILTLVDGTETVAAAGRWFKTHHGPDLGIILIFFFSGLALETGQIRSGLKDMKGLLFSWAIIFIAAPLLAALFSFLGLDTGILIGLFLVAVMPTTLSSGVVMTEAAGGNMAHALLIAISANMAAVFTIPIALTGLLTLVGGSETILIDKWSIMVKLGLFVLLPLSLGLTIKDRLKPVMDRIGFKPQVINQCLILAMVWMALSQSRRTILGSGDVIGTVFAVVFVFHGLLFALAWTTARLGGLGRGRRESVIIMGAQKTLPLSVILQVSLFPEYGLALVVCVLHHLVHLLMDSFLLKWLKGNHGTECRGNR